MDKATHTPSTAPTEKIWECKIGGISDTPTPSWSDGPMRQAVEAAFEKVTGKTPAFLFSGWGASLTEPERAVVENRLPNRAEVERLAAQAAPSSAIIASLCGDVEPVAHMWQHDETGRTGFVEHAPAEELEQWERINRPRRFVAKLYPATTVAALKERVAELEKDAARYQYLRKYSYIELECDSPRSDEWRPEHLDADIDAAIAKKAKDAP